MSIAYEIPTSAASKVINAVLSAGVKPEELCRIAEFNLSALENLDDQMPFEQ